MGSSTPPRHRAACQNGTRCEGSIYLQFEHDEGGGQYADCQLARFNRAWTPAGEPTGDGHLPDRPRGSGN